MNVYDYVAANNPYMARAILKNYGYEPTKGATLGYALKSLVRTEGEPALRDIIQSHPDREIIMDLYSSETKQPAKKCNCASKQYHNADGQQTALATHNSFMQNQSGTFILAAAIFIAAAIIVKS